MANKTIGDHVYERDGPSKWFERQIRLEQAKNELSHKESDGPDVCSVSDLTGRHRKHWRDLFRGWFLTR